MKQIKLEGAYNFRDIGGYITVDGKKVKEGLLYRSDELSKLTEKDIEILIAHNIKTIVDYRGEAERVNNEDKAIEGAKVVYLDPKADVAAMASNENIKDMHKTIDSLTAKKAYQLMMEQNRQFVLADSSKKAYRQLLDLILDKDNCPLVQHCRGGKDRTGYGVAIILLLLGVSKETVLEDYLYTNVCKNEKNEKSLRKIMEETQNEDLVQALRYMKEANAEFLLLALNEIDDNYGGIVNYAINELDFNQENINKLKEIYLEDK